MLDRLKDFFVDNYDLSRDEITLESEFEHDLGLSSFQLVEMCAQLEDELGIEIDENDLPNIVTVNDLMILIKKYSEEN